MPRQVFTFLLAVHTAVALLSSSSFKVPSYAMRLAPRRPANFFAQFMPPPLPSPADIYDPQPSPPAGLPASFDDIYKAAIGGVVAALGAERTVEVDFPPIASLNARGDGSAQSQRLVDDANAAFVEQLQAHLQQSGKQVAVVGCSGGGVQALGSGALALRNAGALGADCDVAICVSPMLPEHWAAANALGAAAVVIVNGLLTHGQHPHAYYYRPLTAYSTQTGGVVRRYPGPYECYTVQGELVDLEIKMARQGNRALPDTKDAQTYLQSTFKRNT